MIRLVSIEFSLSSPTKRTCPLRFNTVYLLICALSVLVACQKTPKTTRLHKVYRQKLASNKPQQRIRVLRGIARMKPDIAAPLLPDVVKALDDPHWLVQAKAVSLCNTLGTRITPHLFTRLNKRNLGYHLDRHSGLAQAARDQQKTLYPKLKKRALYYQGRIRSWALSAMTLFGPKRVLPDFRALLAHKENSLRAAVLRALSQLGPKARPLVPAILPLLHDHASEVRRAAVQALLHIKTSHSDFQKGVAQLVAKDNDTRVRLAAAEALSLWRKAHPKAIKTLLEMLDEPGGLTYFRYRTLEPLGKLAHALPSSQRALKQRVVRKLQAYLQDRMASLRLAAVKALAHMKQDARDATLSLVTMGSKEPHLRRLLLRTLAQVATAKQLTQLLQTVAPGPRALALKVHNQRKVGVPFTALQQALRSSHPTLQIEAIANLHYHRSLPPTFASTLATLAKTHKQPAIRLQALKAFVRLTSNPSPTSQPTSQPTKPIQQTITPLTQLLLSRLRDSSTNVQAETLRQLAIQAKRHTWAWKALSQPTPPMLAHPAYWRAILKGKRPLPPQQHTLLTDALLTKTKWTEAAKAPAFRWLIANQSRLPKTRQKQLAEWWLTQCKQSKQEEAIQLAARGFRASLQVHPDKTAITKKLQQWLRSLLTSKQKQKRIRALLVVQELPFPLMQKQLATIQFIMHEDRESRCRLLGTKWLAKHTAGVPKWRTVWEQLILDPAVSVRLVVLDALQQYKTYAPSTERALVQLIQAKERLTESRAIAQIGKMGPKAIQSLHALLSRHQAESWITRAHVYQAIAQIAPRNKRVQSILTTQSTRDPHPKARQTALNALNPNKSK